MSKTKFYAVKHGRVPGIYSTWEECKAQVNGFSSALYKSFNTEQEAKSFLGNGAGGIRHTSSRARSPVRDDNLEETIPNKRRKLLPPSTEVAASLPPRPLNDVSDMRYQRLADQSRPVGATSKFQPSTSQSQKEKRLSTARSTVFASIDIDRPYVLMTDGASRGNPGKASCAAVLYDPEGNEIRTNSQYLGDRVTNNVAEYFGLLIGLTMTKMYMLEQDISPADFRICCRCDSNLLVRHVRREYKVNDKTLAGILDQIWDCIQESFPHFHIEHVYREHNTRADELANQVIDNQDRLALAPLLYTSVERKRT
eukprot:GILK01012656.1.p1 GENE.GILK01012656.1~~GILK01012656.1.p1  ORF type:complete len:311 (-),score=40.59 GILK01012656.1:86-1018(-)